MRTRREAAAAAALALAAASAGLTLAAVPAGAALGGLTAFAIDGNAQGPNDWEAPYPALRDLNVIEDQCRADPQLDPENPGETLTTDPTTVSGKIDDTTVDSVVPEPGKVPNKTDLCRVYQAWELVRGPTAAGTDQYQVIFYGGWARDNVNGEINVLYTLPGGPAGNEGDLIVQYDFVDATDQTTVDVLTWAGTQWVSTAVPAFAEATTGRGQTVAGIDGEVTFGEVAINLTAAGFLPETGPCEFFTGGAILTRTGNSPQAELKDYVEPPDLSLSNCGAIEVEKQTLPTPASGRDFGFAVYQLDGAPVLAGNVVEVTDTLTVPPNPASTVVEDVLISPDYLVEERSLPPGWAQHRLVCLATDPLTGLQGEYVLYENGAATGETFPVGPGMTAACTISNIGPPTLTLQKVTETGAGGPFSIEAQLGDGTTDHSVDLTTTIAGEPVAGSTREMIPLRYTVVETGGPATFTLVKYVCEVAGLSSPQPSVTESLEPITLELAQGDEAVCTVVNRLIEADLSIIKDPDVKVDPGTTVPFTFSIGNAGPDPAVDARVTDTFPAGLTPIAVVDDGPYTCVLDGQDLTCTIPEHPVDVTATITVSALVSASASPAATFVNTSVVSSSTPDPDLTNNQDSATVTVTSADLAVGKTPDGGTYAPGAAVTWTFTVTNNGPDPATNAALVDTFPTTLTGLSVVDDGPYTCGFEGQKLSCTIPSHPVGVTATITVASTIVGSTPSGTRIDNSATVSARTPDATPGNNTDTGYVTVQALAKTGADPGPLLAAAAALVLLGSGLVGASRRGLTA